MALDFAEIERRQDREVVFLARLTYHDSGGTEKQVRWCGPTLKCGSGIIYREPDDANGAAYYWEPRCSGLTIEHDLGPLRQNVQSISDLSLIVKATADESLRDELTSGRWANKDVDVWALEIDLSNGRPEPTANYQAIYTGRTDKGPTGIEDGSFRIRAYAGIIDPGTLWPTYRWPESQVAAETRWPDGDDNTAADPYTRTIAISWHHFGVFIPPVFGTGVYREVYFFGQRAGAPSDSWNFFVSPQTNCWVEQMWVLGLSDPGQGGGPPYVADVVADYGCTLNVYENTDADLGPVGTSVQVYKAGGISLMAPNNGTYRARAFARVSGPNVGTFSPSPFYIGTGTVREDVDEVLYDVFTDAQLLNTSDPFASGALTSFDSGNPYSEAEAWHLRQVVPLLDDDGLKDYNGPIADILHSGGTPPLLSDVLGDLMRRLNADLVGRYDSTADAVKIAPIWRAPQSGTAADYSFNESDLISRAPLSLVIERDPDGAYANRVRRRDAERLIEPLQSENQIEVRDTRSDESEDTTEQGATKHGDVVEISDQIRWWAHHDDDAAAEAADMLLNERAQDHVVVEAELGLRAFDVEPGETADFEITGVPTTVGQVRTLVQDWVALRVTLTTHHIEFY